MSNRWCTALLYTPWKARCSFALLCKCYAGWNMKLFHLSVLIFMNTVCIPDDWRLQKVCVILYSLSGQAFLEFPLFKISKILNPTNTVEKIYFKKKKRSVEWWDCTFSDVTHPSSGPLSIICRGEEHHCAKCDWLRSALDCMRSSLCDDTRVHRSVDMLWPVAIIYRPRPVKILELVPCRENTKEQKVLV